MVAVNKNEINLNSNRKDKLITLQGKKENRMGIASFVVTCLTLILTELLFFGIFVGYMFLDSTYASQFEFTNFIWFFFALFTMFILVIMLLVIGFGTILFLSLVAIGLGIPSVVKSKSIFGGASIIISGLILVGMAIISVLFLVFWLMG